MTHFPTFWVTFLQAMTYAHCVLKQVTIESLAWTELQEVTSLLAKLIDDMTAPLAALVTLNGHDWEVFSEELEATVQTYGRNTPLLTSLRHVQPWLPAVQRKLGETFLGVQQHLTSRGSLRVSDLMLLEAQHGSCLPSKPCRCCLAVGRSHQ